MSEICEHGELARVCPRCELIDELTAERAKVAELTQIIADRCASAAVANMRANKAESQAALLRAALEEAPHAESCASRGLRYAQQIEQYCDAHLDLLCISRLYLRS